jgi:hypothetical protein
MSGETKFWLAAARAVLLAIIVASTLMTISIGGPWIETKIMPVVQKLQISDLRRGEVPGTSQFIATFNKVRSCEYFGIGWYDDQTDERVNMILLRTDKSDTEVNRPPGYTRTGPWIVSLPPDHIRPPFGWWAKPKAWVGSHALLFHRCNPFWITTTEFYP